MCGTLTCAAAHAPTCTHDRLLREVVDELLGEVGREATTAAAGAEAFAIDMLVAAVVFSTGK
jgi:hypothetical protein